MKDRLTVVDAPDYSAIYIDGEIYQVGYDTNIDDIFGILYEYGPFSDYSHWHLNADGINWIDSCGEFPKFFDDIPSTYFKE